ncbi:hypothetical protein [Sinomicrobium sp. M5D2P9]
MKKLYLLFVFLGSGYLGISQNQYPTAKGSNILLDGGGVNMIKPVATGGWARGINYFRELGGPRFGGIGMLGSGEESRKIYIAYGQTPWNGDGIFLLSNGNVGVGTAEPTAKFHVDGLIRTTGSVQAINPENSGLNMSVGWSNGVARVRMGGSGIAASGGFDIQTAGDKSLMRLLHNGNVGIGTITPDARLAVNGIIHGKEVKVDLNGWSDFVFEENYVLPTLEEVEQHIKEKGHLKDIPSTKEVEKNGIFLGEMDAKLLQKIEELTLYAIQQQKRMDIQQKQIETILEENQQLRKEIDALKKP